MPPGLVSRRAIFPLDCRGVCLGRSLLCSRRVSVCIIGLGVSKSMVDASIPGCVGIISGV